MDLLEVSAGLERIELLAKISNIDEASSKEKGWPYNGLAKLQRTYES